jgi:hypothetical protein
MAEFCLSLGLSRGKVAQSHEKRLFNSDTAALIVPYVKEFLCSRLNDSDTCCRSGGHRIFDL